MTTTLIPPPPPLRYSKRSTIHILQCSRTSMCHLEDLFSHMGARPNANVTMISHVCHGGPISFLLVSWFINVNQHLSVFKVASASKYSKCQWSSTKDKEDTIYRNLFPFVCLFDFSDPAECGVSVTEPRQRIVRGNKATSGVWPWQINIYWDGRHCRLSLMLSQVLVVHDPTPCRL